MKIKIDEQNDEQNMFTIESYMLIQTLPLHNREVCGNRNTTCSSPRSMFPLGIEIVWNYTFFIPFQPVFYLNSIFQTSYV
jgi:hypothetical protein